MACIGHQQITALSSAVALTVPAGTRFALVTCETQNVRWRADGVAPAAGVGMLIKTSDPPLQIDAMNAQFIEVAPSAKLNVLYFN